MKKPQSKPAAQLVRKLWRKRWLRITLIVATILLTLFFTARFWNPIVFPPVKQAHIGVSFSTKQTAILGIDWRETYNALIDDMGIKRFRLMSYWDLHEANRNEYDFSTLDEQIAIAEKKEAKVTLAIGLRQPRWPECHEPDWAVNLDEKKWQAELMEYIEAVVKRYENSPAAISWQLENEYYNSIFKSCRLSTPQRLYDEFDLARNISKKPIWMSMTDQHGFQTDMPAADRYGFSVYRELYSTKGYTGYITYPTPIWYHRLRAAIISGTSGKDIYIHELQLEPWGPTDIPYLSIDEQNKSMSTKHIADNLYFAREIGVRDIYVWGGEWWYWRKVHGDPSIWDTVKVQIREAER